MLNRKNRRIVAAMLAAPFLVAVSSSPLFANDRMGHANGSKHENVRAASQSGRVMSGGVGIGARSALEQGTENFDLKLVFAKSPSGDYLAEVPVTIVDRRGNTVIDAVSDGPWMYVDLPNGTYSVKARFNGRTETRQVSVTSGAQRTVYLRFPEGIDGTESMNVSAAR